MAGDTRYFWNRRTSPCFGEHGKSECEGTRQAVHRRSNPARSLSVFHKTRKRRACNEYRPSRGRGAERQRGKTICSEIFGSLDLCRKGGGMLEGKSSAGPRQDRCPTSF